MKKMASNNIIEYFPALEKKVIISNIKNITVFKIPKVQDKYEFGKYINMLYNHIVEKSVGKDAWQVRDLLCFFQNIILSAWKQQPELVPSGLFFGKPFEEIFKSNIRNDNNADTAERILKFFKRTIARLNLIYSNRHEKLFKKSSEIIYIKKDENNKFYLQKDEEKIIMNIHEYQRFEEFYNSIDIIDKNSKNADKKYFVNTQKIVSFDILVSDRWIDEKLDNDWHNNSIMNIDDDLYIDFEKNKQMYDILKIADDYQKISAKDFPEKINILNFYYQNPELLSELKERFKSEKFDLLCFNNSVNRYNFSNTFIFANFSEYKKIKDEIKKDETKTYIFFTKERIENFSENFLLEEESMFNAHIKIYPGTGPLKEYMEHILKKNEC